MLLINFISALDQLLLSGILVVPVLSKKIISTDALQN